MAEDKPIKKTKPVKPEEPVKKPKKITNQKPINNDGTPRKKLGQPKKTIAKEKFDEIHKLAKIGVSKANIAMVLGMDEDTFHKRLTEDEELYRVYKSGIKEGEKKVTNSLMKLIEDGVPSAIYFYLKCRCGWRETSDINHIGNVTLNHKQDLKGMLEKIKFIKPEDSDDSEGSE